MSAKAELGQVKRPPMWIIGAPPPWPTAPQDAHLEEAGIRGRTWNSNPGIVMWDTAVLVDILTTGSIAHPWNEWFISKSKISITSLKWWLNGVFAFKLYFIFYDLSGIANSSTRAIKLFRTNYLDKQRWEKILRKCHFVLCVLTGTTVKERGKIFMTSPS